MNEYKQKKIKLLWDEIKKRYETYPKKNDADFDVVFQDWVEVLGDYEEYALMSALKNYIKETKSTTYPKIAHLEKYLKFLDKVKTKETNIPADLQEQYIEAKKWHDLKVGSTSWWYEQGYVFWINDLTYAYTEAVKEDMQLNGEKYGSYSHNGQKKLSNEVILALFVQNRDYEGLFNKFLPKDKRAGHSVKPSSLKNVFKKMPK